MMYPVTLDNIKTMAEQTAGQINEIYLHWTAGHYGQFFDDYHIGIDTDGSIHASTVDLTEQKAHTWHRNGGAVGIALSCCYNASTCAWGPEPPTPQQIESIAQVVAALCTGLGLPIDADHVMTHAEAADLDGYGPASTCERWDLWMLPGVARGYGGEIIRGKAIFYQQEGV